jgi:hypothetical protein
MTKTFLSIDLSIELIRVNEEYTGSNLFLSTAGSYVDRIDGCQTQTCNPTQIWQAVCRPSEANNNSTELVIRTAEGQ